MVDIKPEIEDYEAYLKKSLLGMCEYKVAPLFNEEPNEDGDYEYIHNISVKDVMNGSLDVKGIDFVLACRELRKTKRSKKDSPEYYCRHYSEANKSCMFISGCRYPEPRFTCPEKDNIRAVDVIVGKIPFICPYCRKDVARIYEQTEEYRFEVICLNCGKHWFIEELVE